MSANKSPGNQRREDGSKQGNEQNSQKQGSTPLDDASVQQGGQGAQQGEDAGRQRGDRNGSDSGGGKS
ncbi:hypothetical protein [Ramlibacter montanisoli]|jgi:hypothetical protein|uniref:Uncharacterized protein n=1 Tax=Ramlibacter montanisoli TaxID=2732512 RepID=A0A849KCY9_9BURK|nr:hypothetical protein [Ramlibacter montanisoli]NNU42611.1 hypothetical protein [Ramlibacter montanisoli]